VIDALYPLVAEHPTVEPLPAMLMKALHAAGRGADALSCYATTQRRLASELGADPGPELRALHQAILRGELDQGQDADDANAIEVRMPSPRDVPAQLPPDLRGFAGRAEQLTTLDRIGSSTQDHPVTCTTIAVVTGMPGVGKTALAVHWAHHVCAAFPDGQLYVNLRGFGPGDTAVSPGQALRGFLEALHVPAHRIPASLDAQVGMYRSLLADRRMLVVLDNARDVDQVRPLLPGSMRCMVVVTSRDGLAGLVTAEGARPMTLAPMSTQEGRQLLIERLGSHRVDTELAAVEEIVRDCARLPLALGVVAARAAAHPDFLLAVLAKELRETRDGLDRFDAGDTTTDVRSVFSWSYRALSPDAAAMFRRLGLHPGPDIATPAAASLAGVPIRRARAMLSELTRAHLLAEHAPGRFVCHDLLRAYAVELVHAEDPDTDRRAAIHRLLDHYLHTAHAGALLLHSVRDPIELSSPRAGVTPEPISDHDQALAWFTDEHRALMALIRLALDDRFDVHAWQLPWSVHTFLDYRGHWDDQVIAHTAALTGAGRLADLPAQAYALLNLGAANSRLGQYDEAQQQFQRSLDLYGELGGTPTRPARTSIWAGCPDCRAASMMRSTMPNGRKSCIRPTVTGPSRRGHELARLVLHPTRGPRPGRTGVYGGTGPSRGSQRPQRVGRDLGQPRLRVRQTRRPHPGPRDATGTRWTYFRSWATGTTRRPCSCTSATRTRRRPTVPPPPPPGGKHCPSWTNSATATPTACG